MNLTSSDTPVRVATAGEALIDMIEESDGRLRPCAGGAVYNLTRALGLQDVGVLYLNPLSADRFGQMLAQGLQAAKVQRAQPSPVLAPTSLAVVGLDAHGKANYSFYREGVADRRVSAPEMNAQCRALPALSVIATGCLALVADDSAKYLPWLQTQRSEGPLVVVDANLRPAIVPDMAPYRDSVMASLREAHIVKVSDDDLQTLGFTQGDPIEAARLLLRQTQARWLALTLGAKGAVLLQRDGKGWHAVESEAAKVADTVGAGDCFLAGMLTALLERASGQNTTGTSELELDATDLVHILKHAIASASLCVQATGCVPPGLAQVKQRLAAVHQIVNTV